MFDTKSDWLVGIQGNFPVEQFCAPASMHAHQAIMLDPRHAEIVYRRDHGGTVRLQLFEPAVAGSDMQPAGASLPPGLGKTTHRPDSDVSY